jgi:hypothetical protein
MAIGSREALLAEGMGNLLVAECAAILAPLASQRKTRGRTNTENTEAQRAQSTQNGEEY